MPRYENTGPDVEAWCGRAGEGSSTVDLCVPCGAVLEGVEPSRLPARVASRLRRGEPAGILRDGVEHPPYADMRTRCACCEAILTDEDD